MRRLRHAKAASAAVLWAMLAIAIASSCMVNVNGAIWYNPINLGGESLSDSTGSWSSYATAPLTIAVDSTLEKLGTSSIKCAYSDVDTADFYYTFNTPQDLTKYEGLTFWYYGYNTGLMVMVIVTSSGGSSCYYHFYDNNGVGWKHITVYLNVPDAGSWQTIRSSVKKVTWRVSPDASAAVYSAETLPAYMVVRALTGEVSADGVAYASATMPTWTVSTTAEYYQTTLFVNPEGGECVVEFPVPQTYTGLSVEAWDGASWVVKDGAAGYALSVPYIYNNSDRGNFSAYPGAPPTDWAGTGAPSLANASGMGGSLYRVQLAVATEAPLQLRITNCYATSPAVGFDGVDDYILLSGITTYTQLVYRSVFKMYDRNYFLLIYDKEEARIDLRIPDPPTYDIIQAETRTNAGEWKNVVIVSAPTVFTIYDAAGGFNDTHVSGYLNGHLVASVASGPATLKIGDVMLCGKIPLNKHCFHGAVYSFTFYNEPFLSGTNAILIFNASSFSGSSNTTVTDFSGAGNHGTAYGGVQYKANTIEGFQADIINGTAGVFYLDSPKFEDLRSTYMSMGQSDLRNSTVVVNEAYYNFTTYANETANAITFIGFSGGTFVYQPGLNVSAYQNITSNVFTFITADEVADWVLTWDGARLTLSTSPGVDMVDPGDLFSANAAKEFFDERLGIFSYSIVMLIPIAGYLKTKDPGVPAIIFLFFAAAGYYIDPSLAPFAELTVVGGLALLAYRIFWSRGK